MVRESRRHECVEPQLTAPWPAYCAAMTGDQLAAHISFGVPATLVAVYLVGHWVGALKAVRRMEAQLHIGRTARIQRWTPPPPQSGGEPGTPERLLSDYEDAIYVEARHNAFGQYGDADEQHHVAVGDSCTRT